MTSQSLSIGIAIQNPYQSILYPKPGDEIYLHFTTDKNVKFKKATIMSNKGSPIIITNNDNILNNTWAVKLTGFDEQYCEKIYGPSIEIEAEEAVYGENIIAKFNNMVNQQVIFDCGIGIISQNLTIGKNDTVDRPSILYPRPGDEIYFHLTANKSFEFEYATIKDGSGNEVKAMSNSSQSSDTILFKLLDFNCTDMGK